MRRICLYSGCNPNNRRPWLSFRQPRQDAPTQQSQVVSESTDVTPLPHNPWLLLTRPPYQPLSHILFFLPIAWVSTDLRVPACRMR
ncbi:hypothetical protein ElyMa_003301200 [Elysia marginata]|uniref:Uncharacterized protein n=1 Tax=Elysia marginata TaxID=1093978 RepID=A0AAV4JAR2_9GAST|nr:hypothetical protein ElyMa_003301200 [Elysia marginata]